MKFALFRCIVKNAQELVLSQEKGERKDFMVYVGPTHIVLFHSVCMFVCRWTTHVLRYCAYFEKDLVEMLWTPV